MKTTTLVQAARPAGSGMDENQRLRPEPLRNLEAGDRKLSLALDPWAIHYWSLE